MKQTLTLLVLFSTGLFFSAFSQSWTKLQQWGGSGTEICAGLAVAKDGSIVLAGSFENQITFENQALTARGEEDIFLCRLQANGEVAWAKRAGSQLEDEVADIALDADDNLIVAGSYWLKGNFDEIELTTPSNPKAIFIAKYNLGGQLLWAKSLSGTGLKNVEDVVCNQNNEIFLTGYFEKTLQIDDTLLTSNGITDLFLAKFNSEGQLQWAVNQGNKGDTRGTALGLMSNGDAIVAGFFNDTTEIADTILTANTQDQDVFVARFDQNGMPIWAKKAGGVFDSDVTALVIDAQDNIYLTGYFVGVMRLSADLSISSSSGNSDFFLLKYQPDGTPTAARALGGMLLEQALDMEMQHNILLVSGFYQGDMTLDAFSLASGNALSGFVAGFDLNLQTKWLKNLAADAFLYAAQVVGYADNTVMAGGSFTGNVMLDNEKATATSFDLFLAQAELQPTSTEEVEKQILFQVFPNPSNGKVSIQTTVADFSLKITDSSGKVVFSGENKMHIDISHLPKGLYYFTFYAQKTSQTFKMIW